MYFCAKLHTATSTTGSLKRPCAVECFLWGVRIPDTGPLSRKGHMIFELGGGQALKTSQICHCKEFFDCPSLPNTLAAQMHLQQSIYGHLHSLWVCCWKRKVLFCRLTVSFGLNVHWATGLLLKDSDPGCSYWCTYSKSLWIRVSERLNACICLYPYIVIATILYRLRSKIHWA